MRPGKGRRRDSFIWYNNGWHVGGKAELGQRSCHFLHDDAAPRPDLISSMRPWRAALNGSFVDAPEVQCLAGAAGEAALITHADDLQRRLNAAASEVFLVGMPAQSGRGFGAYVRNDRDFNRRPTYVMREPAFPCDAGWFLYFTREGRWAAGG